MKNSHPEYSGGAVDVKRLTAKAITEDPAKFTISAIMDINGVVL